MTWTPPTDWDDGWFLGATLFNKYVRDNQSVLKAPASASYVADEDANYNLSAAGPEAIDATWNFTIVTAGGDVFAGFHATVVATVATPRMNLDIAVDGVLIGGDKGILQTGLTTDVRCISFVRLIGDLLPGEHTFEMQWETAGSIRMYAGSGTADKDYHPQFWVREIS